jgi:hypothetical protein
MQELPETVAPAALILHPSSFLLLPSGGGRGAFLRRMKPYRKEWWTRGK